MGTFRVYSKSEEAYADAAFLCGMGLNATVFDEQGFGGNALGVSTDSIRIELPDHEVTEATALLRRRQTDVSIPSEVPVAPTGTPPSRSLERLFRSLLLANVGFYALFAFGGELFTVTPPKEVDEYIATLALSEDLWRISYHFSNPLVLVCVVSNVLSFFYLRFGRALFAFTWFCGILLQLGPPPFVYGPLSGFLGSLLNVASITALSLMYWSPIRERFRS